MIEREPKITITEKGALQITDRDECKKHLDTARGMISRAEKIIERRRDEIERLKGIEENLVQRYEFLSISGKVEPETWYECKASPESNKTFAFVLSTNEARHSLTAWRFAPDRKQISGGWRGESVFLHPTTNELILSPPKKDHYVVCEQHYAISFQTYELKGERSFLMEWTPSSDLSVMMQDPSILEVKGIIEEMHKEGCLTYQRRLQKCVNEDNNGRGKIEIVKHQGQWWLLCLLE